MLRLTFNDGTQKDFAEPTKIKMTNECVSFFDPTLGFMMSITYDRIERIELDYRTTGQDTKTAKAFCAAYSDRGRTA